MVRACLLARSRTGFGRKGQNSMGVLAPTRVRKGADHSCTPTSSVEQCRFDSRKRLYSLESLDI